jgi:hypothetical protein
LSGASGMSSIFQATTNKMKVPAFVLDPRSFFEGKEAYISIDKIEPESDLAQAVIRLERQQQAPYDRLRQIAAYLQVNLTER